ncbi:MAG: Do family serine endopeptidase [Rhizobiales bacterium]|nr:Do family serine endopeptidase [Hyphomicrobiales bacterium]
MTNTTPNQAETNVSKPARIATKRVLALTVAGLLAATSLTAMTGFTQPGPAQAQAVLNKAPAEGFADLVEQVMPAVFSVEVEFTPVAFEGHDMPRGEHFPEGSPFRHFFDQFQGKRFGQQMPQRQPRRQGQGSGFVITADGYAVTNNHVIDGAKEVKVKFSDGKFYTAKVIGTDRKTDLALLKIETDKKFTPVKFATKAPRVGDWVIAVGNPFGLGGSVTTGIVSAQGRNIGSGPYDDFLQIDAPINRGNSGGPAFNLNGEVIGVNTAIYSPSGGSVGIGFAIPAAITQDVIDDLKDDGSVTRGWLGVQIQPVTGDIAESLGLGKATGAIVTDVTRGSPAANGGLQTGDTILNVNSAEVKGARDLARKVATIKPGSKAKMTIMRAKKQMTVEIKIGTMPKDTRQLASKSRPEAGSAMMSLGLKLKPSETGQGVEVVAVKPSSPAAMKRLQRGDVILEVAGIAVDDPQSFAAAVEQSAAEGSTRVLLLVKSGNRQRFVAVPTEQG